MDQQRAQTYVPFLTPPNPSILHKRQRGHFGCLAFSFFRFTVNPHVLFADAVLLFRLQALEAFIHTQRQLLERQRSDIDKLHRLRVDLCTRPAQVLGNLSNEVSFVSSRLLGLLSLCCFFGGRRRRVRFTGLFSHSLLLFIHE